MENFTRKPVLTIAPEAPSTESASLVEVMPATPCPERDLLRGMVEGLSSTCGDALKLASAGVVLVRGLPLTKQSEATRAWLADHVDALEQMQEPFKGSSVFHDYIERSPYHRAAALKEAVLSIIKECDFDCSPTLYERARYCLEPRQALVRFEQPTLLGSFGIREPASFWGRFSLFAAVGAIGALLLVRLFSGYSIRRK